MARLTFMLMTQTVTASNSPSNSPSNTPSNTLGIALFQPDMPQNCGAIMRLCACFGVPLHLIEPFGFIWDDARVRRVAMDYIEHVNLSKHQDWDKFVHTMSNAGMAAQAVAPLGAERMAKKRLILLSTKAATPYTDFKFQANDVLLLGRESAGVPEYVHAHVDARVVIPLQNGMRSLNVGMSAAIVLSEAIRQIRKM